VIAMIKMQSIQNEGFACDYCNEVHEIKVEVSYYTTRFKTKKFCTKHCARAFLNTLEL
jgi:hypothetical protein